jgi:tetratricopeptide (TPR) repeat protein
MYRRALAIDSVLFGERHEYLAIVMRNLGTVKRDQNSLDEAETLFTRSLELYRELFGEDHSGVAAAQSMLASVAHQRGSLREADALYSDAIGKLREVFPDGHPQLASALVGKARLLIEIDEAPGAEPLLREAIRMFEASLGMREPRTIDTYRDLADCLIALGRFQEAESTLLAAWQALDRIPYAQRERASAARSLVRLYESTGRPKDAERFRLVLAASAAKPASPQR